MSEPDLTPIGSELRARKERRDKAFQRWLAGQGAKIKALKPYPVYAACALEAMHRCGRKDWQHAATPTQAGWEGLTMAQVKQCEERALSTWRVRMHGNIPPSNEAWDSQIAQVRHAWASPQQEEAA